MAIIRVSCPTCGEIELPSEWIEPVTVPGRPVDRNNTHYTFTCSLCDAIVRCPADRITATVLMSGGVAMRPPRHPVFADRPGHPERPPGGPAFTPDDILDLHLLLEDDGWFAALLAVRQPPGS